MFEAVVFGIQDDLRDAGMSTENITETRRIDGNRLLVVFETREGKELKYSYGPQAAKKIQAGRDPSEFKSRREK